MSDDFCEYVYNPLMRQYQAMMRLMQMLRDSQAADCNDIECFTDGSPSMSNPLTTLNNAAGNDSSFLVTYGPMMMVWAVFVLALFMFRPNSMRRKPQSTKKSTGSDPNANPLLRNQFRDFDDDDNSNVS